MDIKPEIRTRGGWTRKVNRVQGKGLTGVQGEWGTEKTPNTEVTDGGVGSRG